MIIIFFWRVRRFNILNLDFCLVIILLCHSIFIEGIISIDINSIMRIIFCCVSNLRWLSHFLIYNRIILFLNIFLCFNIYSTLWIFLWRIIYNNLFKFIILYLLWGLLILIFLFNLIKCFTIETIAVIIWS